MTDIWSFQADAGSDDRDVVGYDVAATDGGIGSIDESSIEAGRQHLVVDTGFWIFGKKRLIPAGAVARIDHGDRTVYVEMTREQIRGAPDFDASRCDDDDFRSAHASFYDPYRR